MIMRTKEQINKQINGLQGMKSWLPQFNTFSENNWEKIDKQIDVLAGELDFEEFENEFFFDDEDSERKDYDLLNDLQKAYDWLHEIDGEDLFEEHRYKSSDYSPIKIADIIKLDLKDWPGNCYGIASSCVELDVVKGKLRYGHYKGFIAENSFFAKKRNLGFVQHGWVELEDGRVFDPTRWVFENIEPYIYVGPNKEYNVGGTDFRDMLIGEPPLFNNEKVIEFSFAPDILKHISTLLNDTRNENKFSINQVFYLGNLNPNKLHPYAKEIYEEIERVGEIGLIPIDCWDLIMNK